MIDAEFMALVALELILAMVLLAQVIDLQQDGTWRQLWRKMKGRK